VTRGVCQGQIEAGQDHSKIELNGKRKEKRNKRKDTKKNTENKKPNQPKELLIRGKRQENVN